MYQYRINVNGETRTRPAYPSDWPRIAEAADERGMSARLDRRCVFDDDSILSLLTSPDGYMRLPGGRVVSPWQTMARIN